MLTNTKLKTLKPKSKSYRVADMAGLYVQVTPAGTISWRYNYLTAQGKAATKTYGKFPDLGLADARDEHAAFKKNITTQKKSKSKHELVIKHTFSEIAEQWLAVHLTTLSNNKHKIQVQNTIERHVLPSLGQCDIATIKRADLVAIVRDVSARGTIETAQRVGQRISAIFDFAIDLGVLESHPAAGLSRVLPKKKVRHLPAVKKEELPALMNAIDQYADPVTRIGLLLLAHTFLRTSELIGATWKEFDLKTKIWVIPEKRMKMKIPHVVPLSDQVIALLKDLRNMTGDSEYLLSSPYRIAHISNNTLLFALYRLGYKGIMTGHGFRSVASSILNESGLFHADAIERQLAHSETDKVRGAYHRAEFLAERQKMMDWWSDYLINCANDR